MTKVISLSDRAYGELKRRKGEGDSFSDVVLRLTGSEESGSILAFAGAWTGSDLAVVEEAVMKERERAGRDWSS